MLCCAAILGRQGAIVVYPMNALVNSQEDALRQLVDGYLKRTGKPMPVRFAKYTGQESDEEKLRLRQKPPHILLIDNAHRIRTLESRLQPVDTA